MDDIVARARALVGCRYRAQGRDPRFGLDCVGVVCRTFGIPIAEVLRDYRLRGKDEAGVREAIGLHFHRVGEKAPGDLMLMASVHDQLHLAVATERGFIHADAGLRRVVETPGEPLWPVIGRFRRRTPHQTD